nr:GGDEF domain-containing protein [Cellulomonas sp. APG4]
MRSLDDRARRDPLTGLLNRRGLDDVLDRAWAAAGDLHVAVLDLDHFKAVNDAHGHAAGDLVLVRFAEVLSAHVRGDDVVARTGGEEFTVVLGPCSPDVALRRVRELVGAFAAVDLEVPGALLRCTASAGVATREPRHHGAADLLRDADRALYAAKDAGRDRALAAAEVSVPTQAAAPRVLTPLGRSGQG